MFSVGSNIIWAGTNGSWWSGVVEKLANYGGPNVAHCSWDGIVVPAEYECGKPMPQTPYPHVPVSELHPRVPKADDEKRKALRVAAIENYKAQQRLRFVGVKPGTAVTWTVAGAQVNKGKIDKLFLEESGNKKDYALVTVDQGLSGEPVPLMDIQIV